MPVPDLHDMLLQATELAADKEASLEAASAREVEAERTLAAVRAEKKLCIGSAHSANELVVALRQRIQQQEDKDQQTSAGVLEQSGSGAPPSARDAVRRAIREFLHEREEATTKEITQHIQRVLPEVNAGNTSPELTHLFQRGVLVRTRLGVYRLGGE
ncbi:hypothetical protein ACWDR3_32715 [Streptomyces sp. NPDC001002]